MTIIATIIGKIILSLKKIIRKRLSPNANYIIWFVFLIALIFPVTIPSRISIYNFIDISDVRFVGNEKKNNLINLWDVTENDVDIESSLSDNTNKNNYIIWRNYVRRVIAFVWFIGFLVVLIKTLLSYATITLVTKFDEVKDERIVSILEKAKKRLGVRKNIKVVKQNVIKMPSTIGIFNVKILVTDSFLELNEVAIMDVFIHELSHYKRKDNVVNFIVLFLKAVYWFNPIFRKVFQEIRSDIEFATDEMAISKMNGREKKIYCKVMVAIAGMHTLKGEVLLGLSNETKDTIEERISTIKLKQKFEENARAIVIVTISIMLLMCLVFYPTSYGMNEVPRLFLKLNNGDKVEVTRLKEDDAKIDEIRVRQNSETKIVVKDGKASEHIYYSRIDLENLEFEEETANIISKKIKYYESGEYIYKFTLTYGKNQTADYAIKIIVE